MTPQPELSSIAVLKQFVTFDTPNRVSFAAPGGVARIVIDIEPNVSGWLYTHGDEQEPFQAFFEVKDQSPWFVFTYDNTHTNAVLVLELALFMLRGRRVNADETLQEEGLMSFLDENKSILSTWSQENQDFSAFLCGIDIMTNVDLTERW